MNSLHPSLFIFILPIFSKPFRCDHGYRRWYPFIYPVLPLPQSLPFFGSFISVKTFPTIHHIHRRWLSFLQTLPFIFWFFFSSSILYHKTKMSVFTCCCCCLVVWLFAVYKLACCCCHIVIAITFVGCFTSRFIYLRFVFQLHSLALSLSLYFSENCFAFILSASSCELFSRSIVYIFISGVTLLWAATVTISKVNTFTICSTKNTEHSTAQHSTVRYKWAHSHIHTYPIWYIDILRISWFDECHFKLWVKFINVLSAHHTQTNWTANVLAKQKVRNKMEIKDKKRKQTRDVVL